MNNPEDNFARTNRTNKQTHNMFGGINDHTNTIENQDKEQENLKFKLSVSNKD